MSDETLMPEVIRVPLESVHPNDYNPNVVPEHTMQALRANVNRAGFNQPVLVRPHPTKPGEYEIVDGEHRWRVMQEEGREEVPVIVRDFTDAEAKAQTIAMNKLRGEMDPADVARLVRETEEAGLAIADLSAFTGYTEAELEAGQKLLHFDWSDLGAPPSDDDTPPDPDDRWIDLKFRVPQAVADLVNAELDRLLAYLGHEGSPDHAHLALELMAVNSTQTPEEHIGGDE